MLQCIIFAYIYNIDKLIKFININSRIDRSYIRFSVKYVIPIVLSILILFGVYKLVNTLNLVSLLVYIVVILFVVIFTLILRYMSNKNETSS